MDPDIVSAASLGEDPFGDEAAEMQIRDRMESARLRMKEQLRADEIKRELVAKAAAAKTAEVAARVVKFRESDPEMFEYITKLESINSSIWCVTCEKVMQVGDAPTSTPVAAPPAPAPVATPSPAPPPSATPAAAGSANINSRIATLETNIESARIKISRLETIVANAIRGYEQHPHDSNCR